MTTEKDRPVQEIEITQEMIEAGVAAYLNHQYSDPLIPLHDQELPDMIRDVFRAMHRLQV